MIAVWIEARPIAEDRGKKRPKKTYLLRWQKPERGPDGLPARTESGRVKMLRFSESTEATDRKAAEEARALKWREVNGLDVPPEPVEHVSLGALKDLDAEWLRNRERAEGTIYLSGLALTQFSDALKAAGRPLNADEADAGDVERFIQARHGDGVKARAINHGLAALRAAWGRAVKRGVLKENPFAKLEKLQEIPRPIVPLTPAEETKLLSPCAGDVELDAFVRLALDTGCRAGELCAMRRDALDLDAGLGRVECNADWKSKTRRDRPIAFTPATAARVRLWLAGRNGSAHVFRTAADAKPRDCYYRIAQKFKAAVDGSGIGRNVTLQDLRRTVGSLLAERGVNQRLAMEVLGHADISTTARFYQAVRPETIRGVVVNLRKTGTEDRQ